MVIKSKRALFTVGVLLFIFISSNILVFLQVLGTNAVFNPVQPVSAQENKVEQKLRLIVLSEPVFVQLPESQNFIEVKKETHVPVYSVISTGNSGKAELLYPNKSVTRVNVNSKIQIKSFSEEPQKSIVSLLQGTIWNRIAKLVGKESFQTEIGDIVATVRGTAYQMQVLPDGTAKVMVDEGSVGVKKKDNELAVEVNQQVVVPPESENPGVEAYYPDVSDAWVQMNTQRDADLMKQNQYRYQMSPTPTREPVPTIAQFILPYIAPMRYLSPTPKLEPCTGPDDITFLAKPIDCKNLTDFWNKVNPKR